LVKRNLCFNRFWRNFSFIFLHLSLFGTQIDRRALLDRNSNRFFLWNRQR
jgi:hypothetical protein